MEEVLEQARRMAEEAEVFFLSAEQTPVSFEANRLKLLQSRQSHGVSLRIIKDGRIGFAATTDLSRRHALVEAALESAPYGAEARFTLPSALSYEAVDVFDAAAEAVSVETMVELGQRLIDRVRSHTPGLVCDAGVSKTTLYFRLINSKGVDVSYHKTVFGVGLQGTLVRGTDMLFVGGQESSCYPITDIDEIAEDTIRQLEMARETATLASGEVPVVFTHRGVISLLWPVSVALNGKNVIDGSSPLAAKLGQTLFDQRLSTWDDPTIPYRPGSRPCDDEGLPTRRTPLIAEGVVANFLYDLQTAARAGTKSTASAHRSVASLPSPSSTAIVVDSGDASFDDMLADMGEGLVVERLMGAGQGSVLAGDFSGNVLLGYKVEGGRIVGRVKDVVLSGNVYEALSNLVAIGSERRWVGGMLYTPPIYCRGLSVAVKA